MRQSPVVGSSARRDSCPISSRMRPNNPGLTRCNTRTVLSPSQARTSPPRTADRKNMMFVVMLPSGRGRTACRRCCAVLGAACARVSTTSRMAGQWRSRNRAWRSASWALSRSGSGCAGGSGALVTVSTTRAPSGGGFAPARATGPSGVSTMAWPPVCVPLTIPVSVCPRAASGGVGPWVWVRAAAPPGGAGCRVVICTVNWVPAGKVWGGLACGEGVEEGDAPAWPGPKGPPVWGAGVVPEKGPPEGAGCPPKGPVPVVPKRADPVPPGPPGTEAPGGMAGNKGAGIPDAGRSRVAIRLLPSTKGGRLSAAVPVAAWAPAWRDWAAARSAAAGLWPLIAAMMN